MYLCDQHCCNEVGVEVVAGRLLRRGGKGWGAVVVGDGCVLKMLISYM